MDPLEFLCVRFHFGGEFFNDGKKLHYLGGNEEMSFIERDKISLPEVIGHLKDYYNASEPVLLHWLFPGKDLLNGLRVLVDDKACLDMSECVTDGGVADVFVELIEVEADGMETEEEEDGEDQCSDWEEDAQMESERADSESTGMETPHEDNVVVEDLAIMNMSSPEQLKKDLVGATKYLHWVREKKAPVQRLVMQEEVSVHGEAPVQKEHSSDMDDPSDKDYLPGDDESSGEDEEAI